MRAHGRARSPLSARKMGSGATSRRRGDGSVTARASAHLQCTAQFFAGHRLIIVHRPRASHKKHLISICYALARSLLIEGQRTVARMTTEAGTTLKPSGETTSGDFEPEQKRYLEGFVAGLQIAKTAKGIGASATDASLASDEPIGPEAAARKAQDRVIAAGGKLSRS